uniref:DUF1618 domain-containing protein n=1 Tax=Oryza brachyantha TaxID=4533 RepID=J3MHQ8_ORYBR
MAPRKLRDMMPLPWPAQGNRRRYLSGGESFVRDIIVSRHKGSIKYVEMEITVPSVSVVTTTTTTISSSSSEDKVSRQRFSIGYFGDNQAN